MLHSAALRGAVLASLVLAGTAPGMAQGIGPAPAGPRADFAVHLQQRTERGEPAPATIQRASAGDSANWNGPLGLVASPGEATLYTAGQVGAWRYRLHVTRGFGGGDMAVGVGLRRSF